MITILLIASIFSPQSLASIKEICQLCPSRADLFSDSSIPCSVASNSTLASPVNIEDLTHALKKSELQITLEKLQKDFSTPQDRSGDHFSKYTSALKEILALTDEGKRVLECFNTHQAKLASGTPVPLGASRIIQAQASYTGSGLFTYGLNPQENELHKEISLNPNKNPIITLVTLAHEMEHSCSNDDFHLRHTAQFNRPRTPEAIRKFKRNAQIIQARDEIRAYRVNYKIFSELALSAPELCSQESEPSVIFNQPISPPELYSTIEHFYQSPNNDAFMLRFLDLYTSSPYNIYDRENIFSSQGVLLEDVRECLENEKRQIASSHPSCYRDKDFWN